RSFQPHVLQHRPGVRAGEVDRLARVIGEVARVGGVPSQRSAERVVWHESVLTTDRNVEKGVGNMSSPLTRDSFHAAYPNLFNFLGGWFPDADFDGLTDAEVARNFASRDALRTVQAVGDEARRLLGDIPFPREILGECANRYFTSPEEARRWLEELLE